MYLQGGTAMMSICTGWQIDLSFIWFLCFLQTIWIIRYVLRAYHYYATGNIWKLPDLTIIYLVGIVIYGISSLLFAIDPIGLFGVYSLNEPWGNIFVPWVLGLMQSSILIALSGTLAQYCLAFYAILNMPADSSFSWVKYYVYCSRVLNIMITPVTLICAIACGFTNRAVYASFFFIPTAALIFFNGFSFASQLLFLVFNASSKMEGTESSSRISELDHSFAEHESVLRSHGGSFAEEIVQFRDFQYYAISYTLFADAENIHHSSSTTATNSLSSESDIAHLNDPFLRTRVISFPEPPSWAVYNNSDVASPVSVIRERHASKLLWNRTKVISFCICTYLLCTAVTVALFWRAYSLLAHRQTLVEYLYLNVSNYDPIYNIFLWVRYAFVFLLLWLVPIVTPHYS